ncbi:transcriptional regulator [Leptospira noguchii]|uniref:transcriptional regulator n=1 Tax=Leptospira noguchii TaxID=28182 RepID=UPI0009E5C285|nr:transcriptional regulator [Leptospira noguchii]
MSSKKNQSVDQIIAKWKECLDSEESDKMTLIDFIREFAKEKRGNVLLLAKETGIDGSVISHLVTGKQAPPSMERIVDLSTAVKKLRKSH